MSDAPSAQECKRLAERYQEAVHACGFMPSREERLQIETEKALLHAAIDILAALARSEPPTCPTCRGNDMDMPCGNPSRGAPGCLRDKRLATRSEPPTGEPAPGYADSSMAFTDEHVRYIARYGGRCRDCADENGVCPSSGLPCGGADKAIRHVLGALSYGVNHGYVSRPIAALPIEAQASPLDAAGEAELLQIYADLKRDWGGAIPEGWKLVGYVNEEALRGMGAAEAKRLSYRPTASRSLPVYIRAAVPPIEAQAGEPKP